MRFVFSESMDEVRLEDHWPQGRAPVAASKLTFSSPQSKNGDDSPAALSRVRLALLAAATDVITALFPTNCLVCEGPLTSLARERVCERCVQSVRLQSEALCSRCGEALGMESARFAGALGMRECTACRLAAPPFLRATSFAVFEDEARELLHLLKFGGHKTLARRVLGQWLATAMLAAIEGRGSEFLVVPVPMYSARERSRGFNQATLLARAALRPLHKARPDLRFLLDEQVLERVRDTQPLFALGASQRRRTLKGAFRVRDAAAFTANLKGREVLLVDDIMTTGATARECARVLLRAGASAVTVATVARAQPESAASAELWDAEAVARWDAPASGIAADTSLH